MTGTAAEERLAYNKGIEELRPREFPMLHDDVYLDHAGTTLYSKSLMNSFVADMSTHLYGNPHSASTSSQRSTSRVDDVRLAALRFFGADPLDFDLVFVANATAGIKLVSEAFRAMPAGFHYLYHQDSHTSLVGVRQEATTSRCLTDNEVGSWLDSGRLQDLPTGSPLLFAYPAQSNMDGQKFPLDWSSKARLLEQGSGSRIFTLLDAAALVATSPLNLSDVETAPDFVVLSLNKIFGFPNLGALIVRRQAYPCFQYRRYFGGGTVDMVLSAGEEWHSLKSTSPHDALEDGTLPLHNILALDHAMAIHSRLFGSMEDVAGHTTFLRRHLFERLQSLRHATTDAPVCTIYHSSRYPDDHCNHGPTLAFNIRDEVGAWVSTAEFEKLAVLKHFHIRTGGLCNPGGVAAALQLQPWEQRRNFAAGFRCDNGNDIMDGKPTGVIRVSLGAMSTLSDVDRFAEFVDEFYCETNRSAPEAHIVLSSPPRGLYIDQLVVYPIKSCGGFHIPAGRAWEVRQEGLAWDREWCLVHLGTGHALSQKRYPRMALIKPSLDLRKGTLDITYKPPKTLQAVQALSIPLSSDASAFRKISPGCTASSRVCGENVQARTYSSDEINRFFSRILEVPCALARFPAGGSGQSMRHAKAHLQKHQRQHAAMATASKMAASSMCGGAIDKGVVTPPDSDNEVDNPRILLSNESPILGISLRSLQALNDEIARSGRGLPVSAEVFRANIVFGQRQDDTRSSTVPPSISTLQPYDEDHWSALAIRGEDGSDNSHFRMLGSCRRCHMVCINQDTAEKSEEPFVTLSKTRKFDGKVFFGTHMCWTPPKPRDDGEVMVATIRTGAEVIVNS